MTNTEIATSFYSLVEQQKLDEAYALLADDMVVVGPAPEPLGKREYTAVHTAWATACSDWRFNCSKAEDLGEGKVKTTIAITATNDGEIVGLPVPGLPARIPASGRKAKLPTEEPVMTIRDGKIARLEFVTPPGGGVPGLLKQFGVL